MFASSSLILLCGQSVSEQIKCRPSFTYEIFSQSQQLRDTIFHCTLGKYTKHKALSSCFLQIAKVLLHNISAWNRTGGPILVVCFTNHALDQFLEGIHSFHPDGIVRVGGRSKSETIQECSLSKLKDELMKVT